MLNLEKIPVGLQIAIAIGEDIIQSEDDWSEEIAKRVEKMVARDAFDAWMINTTQFSDAVYDVVTILSEAEIDDAESQIDRQLVLAKKLKGSYAKIKIGDVEVWADPEPHGYVTNRTIRPLMPDNDSERLKLAHSFSKENDARVIFWLEKIPVAFGRFVVTIEKGEITVDNQPFGDVVLQWLKEQVENE